MYMYRCIIIFLDCFLLIQKGAAGVKICGQCVAVVGVGRSFSGCVSVACTDSAKWLTIDDDQFWALATKISDAAVGAKKGEFALLLTPNLIFGDILFERTSRDGLRMQKSHGFTYDEHGLIFQNESRIWMKPMSIWTYVSMHCLFSNGILAAEVDATMDLLNTRGLTYEVLRQMAATGYHFQGDHTAKRLRQALSPCKEKTCHGGWKGFAAETLLVLAFCVMLVSKHCLEGLEESERWIIESLRAGWQVASASFACKYLYDGLWPDAAAACLKQALDKFMTAHTHAHKDDLLVPQDH